MSLLRCILVVLAGILFAACAGNGTPLRATLACSHGTELIFHVTIENTGTMPAAAALGGILGNGTRFLTRATLTVRRNARADVQLMYVNASVVRVAGRVDPWAVILSGGESETFTVPARHFVSLPDHIPDGFAAPARVQLQLESRDIGTRTVDAPGAGSVPVWVGVLTSDWIDVPGSCTTR